MDEKVRKFLEQHHTAVMTTTKKDGTPHVAMVGIGLVNGELWSSGTQQRVRTGHLRRNPKAALCVLNLENRYSWLGLEATVDILDGPDAVEQNLALYRVLAGEPDDLEGYKAAMVEEERLVYRFNIERTYGML